MLHALQAAHGHVPAEAHGPIAAALNITRVGTAWRDQFLSMISGTSPPVFMS